MHLHWKKKNDTKPGIVELWDFGPLFPKCPPPRFEGFHFRMPWKTSSQSCTPYLPPPPIIREGWCPPRQPPIFEFERFRLKNPANPPPLRSLKNPHRACHRSTPVRLPSRRRRTPTICGSRTLTILCPLTIHEK